MPECTQTPFRFESLAIWHGARELSSRVHQMTRWFPREEVFALTSQMNRAADAVSLLIAEGSGLQTPSLFRHRLSLAMGEIFEVVSGSFLALDRKYLTTEQHAEIYGRAATLGRQIHRFSSTLR